MKKKNTLLITSKQEKNVNKLDTSNIEVVKVKKAHIKILNLELGMVSKMSFLGSDVEQWNNPDLSSLEYISIVHSKIDLSQADLSKVFKIQCDHNMFKTLLPLIKNNYHLQEFSALSCDENICQAILDRNHLIKDKTIELFLEHKHNGGSIAVEYTCKPYIELITSSHYRRMLHFYHYNYTVTPQKIMELIENQYTNHKSLTEAQFIKTFDVGVELGRYLYDLILSYLLPDELCIPDLENADTLGCFDIL